MQMDHDGGSLSPFFLSHSFVAQYDDDQDFIPRWIFFIMSRQINQLTNLLSALLQHTGFSQS
jgi:hypothetical protein